MAYFKSLFRYLLTFDGTHVVTGRDGDRTDSRCKQIHAMYEHVFTAKNTSPV